MDAIDDPAERLAEIDDVRRRTRAGLYLSWFPLVLYGVVSLGAAALAAVSTKYVGAYWFVAWIVCFVAVGRYAAARADRIGLGGSPNRRYTRLWIGFFVVLFVAITVAVNIGGGAPAIVATSSVLLCAVYLVIARWERSMLMAFLGIAVAVSGVTLAALDPPYLVALANLAIGVVLIAGGLYARSLEERP